MEAPSKIRRYAEDSARFCPKCFAKIRGPASKSRDSKRFHPPPMPASCGMQFAVIGQLKERLRKPVKSHRTWRRIVLIKACSGKASTVIQTREKRNMPDNYTYQSTLSKSEQSDQKEDDFSDLEDHNVSEPPVAEMRLRSVMSQYEMEILTTLFPKYAQTLAGVLRDRP